MRGLWFSVTPGWVGGCLCFVCLLMFCADCLVGLNSVVFAGSFGLLIVFAVMPECWGSLWCGLFWLLLLQRMRYGVVIWVLWVWLLLRC